MNLHNTVKHRRREGKRGEARDEVGDWTLLLLGGLVISRRYRLGPPNPHPNRFITAHLQCCRFRSETTQTALTCPSTHLSSQHPVHACSVSGEPRRRTQGDCRPARAGPAFRPVDSVDSSGKRVWGAQTHNCTGMTTWQEWSHRNGWVVGWRGGISVPDGHNNALAFVQ